jgi:5'-nucleotidase
LNWANFKDIVISDPIENAANVAVYLKTVEKCDLIVCLSHLGWNTQKNNDQILITSTKYIDIVFGEHTHTYLESSSSFVMLKVRMWHIVKWGKMHVLSALSVYVWNILVNNQYG